MSTYDELVETARMTCGACPLQYEGTLQDGRSFYFRYRWGYATLGIAESVDAAIAKPGASLEVGAELDGWLDDFEFRETFVRLYDLHNPESSDTIEPVS